MKYLKLFEQSKYDSEILEIVEKYWDVEPFQLKDVINSEIEDLGIKKMSFLFEMEDMKNSYYVDIDEDDNIHWIFGKSRADLDKFPGTINMQKEHFFDKLIRFDETTNGKVWIKVRNIRQQVDKPWLKGIPDLTFQRMLLPHKNSNKKSDDLVDLFYGKYNEGSLKFALFFPQIVISIPNSSDFNETINSKCGEYNKILEKVGIPYFFRPNYQYTENVMKCYVLSHL